MDFLSWGELENWFLTDLIFFPALQMALLKWTFYPLFFFLFLCLVLFETFLISPKEGPNTSLSLSLPADYNLKPPFPISHEQGYLYLIIGKKHTRARLSMIYNVLGSAEVLAKIAFIAFITFWSVIVTYSLIYLKGVYLHIAFGFVHEKFPCFALNNYRCCSLDLYQLWAPSSRQL